MKPPEEIKKGLAACSADECHGQHEGCTYQDQFFCTMRMCGDALAYIHQLEAGIDHAEKVARECAKSITENLDKLQAKLFKLESDNESKQKRIEELESRLAQVERERDAAVNDLDHALREIPRLNIDCYFCKSKDKPQCDECFWEWRGVCEGENT